MIISAPGNWVCCVSIELLSETKLSFAPRPCENLQERVTQHPQRGKSAKISFLLSLFLPFSSELQACLKVQVMMPVLNGPWSSGQVQRYQKLVSKADEKMMLFTLLSKEFKVWGFKEIQRWEPRGKFKIVPWLWKIGLFFPAGKSNSHSCALQTISHT